MLEPYNILFYKGDSVIGRVIRVFSKPYSHCAIILDQFHTLETTWNNPSVIRHFAYRYQDYDVYKLNIRLNNYQKQLITQYITEHISEKYDFLYLITRGLHLLFGTKIINSKNKLTCDELIYEAFKIIGIRLIENDEMLTPSSLAKSKYLERVYV